MRFSRRRRRQQRGGAGAAAPVSSIYHGRVELVNEQEFGSADLIINVYVTASSVAEAKPKIAAILKARHIGDYCPVTRYLFDDPENSVRQTGSVTNFTFARHEIHAAGSIEAYLDTFPFDTTLLTDGISRADEYTHGDYWRDRCD
jgi:hypothetical protein